MIGIKPAPSDHESNFKKVGAISSEPRKTYEVKSFYINAWLHIPDVKTLF